MLHMKNEITLQMLLQTTSNNIADKQHYRNFIFSINLMSISTKIRQTLAVHPEIKNAALFCERLQI